MRFLSIFSGWFLATFVIVFIGLWLAFFALA